MVEEHQNFRLQSERGGRQQVSLENFPRAGMGGTRAMRGDGSVNVDVSRCYITGPATEQEYVSFEFRPSHTLKLISRVLVFVFLKKIGSNNNIGMDGM